MYRISMIMQMQIPSMHGWKKSMKPYFPASMISDRYITVESANFKIIDEVGHFSSH